MAWPSTIAAIWMLGRIVGVGAVVGGSVSMSAEKGRGSKTGAMSRCGGGKKRWRWRVEVLSVLLWSLSLASEYLLSSPH